MQPFETPTGFDFLALGEAVVDFISSDFVPNLNRATNFNCFVGGQATNLAMNMARLGNHAALGTCIGDDGFGRLIQEKIKAAGVSQALIQIISEAPTTLIPVTRTNNGTPDFIVYRGADTQLKPDFELFRAAEISKILHVSAFGLSRDPARSTIIQAMKIARENGQRVSLDPNYHPKLWPDVPDFLDILWDAFQYVNITKPSMDDCKRLFGQGMKPAAYANRFLDLGVELVVITMGADGVFLANSNGEQYQIKPNKIEAVDVTGAGDAFWSGLLTALLDGYSHLDALRFGQVVAEIKIKTLGPISNTPNLEDILMAAQLIKYKSISS